MHAAPKLLAVAAVAAVAILALPACGGDDADGGDTTGGGGGGQTVQVTAGDIFFEPTELSAEAGEVTIEMVNDGSAEHTFLIEELDDRLVADAPGGENDRGTVELEAGTYTFYCNVPGHREAGMEGALTVS